MQTMVYFPPPWTGRLQADLDVLKRLFGWLGLRINFTKNVGVVCQPFLFWGGHLEASYERRMTGEVPSYRERQR